MALADPFTLYVPFTRYVPRAVGTCLEEQQRVLTYSSRHVQARA